MIEKKDSSQNESIKKPKDVWVVVDSVFDKTEDVVLEMIGEGRRLAQRLNQNICAVLLGKPKHVPVDLFSSHGVQKVYLVDHPLLVDYTPDTHAAAMISLISQKKPYFILFADTANGSDLAATIAVRLGVGMIPGCTAIKMDGDGILKATRPIYEQKIYSTVIFQTNACPKIATLKPGSIGVDKINRAEKVQLEEICPDLEISRNRIKVLGYNQADAKTMDLSEADIIVAGGHGVSKDNWHLIEDLSGLLNGAVAGSRMALDDGLIARERLIGQSGKTVKPALIIAIGISGAAHHTEGMKESDRIIVINKDKTAPFFKLANLSIVADLTELIPKLIKQLRQFKMEIK